MRNRTDRFAQKPQRKKPALHDGERAQVDSRPTPRPDSPKRSADRLACAAPPSNCAAAATCVSADGPFARLKEGFEEINKQAKEEFEKAKLRSHWQHEETIVPSRRIGDLIAVRRMTLVAVDSEPAKGWKWPERRSK